MFSPWLVPYYPQSMPKGLANWIKQVLSNNDVLLPWSELSTERAELMVHSFVDCIEFLLSTLPTSESILGHIFYWYEFNFGKLDTPRHLVKSLNVYVTRLPWKRFQPQLIHIEGMYRNLQQVNYGIFSNKTHLVSYAIVCFSFCPNAMRLWVTCFCASPGSHGSNTI